MTSIVPLRTVRNEASEWLARLQSEYATGEDRAQFEAWAAADPQRREAYAQLAGTWHRMESLQDFEPVPAPNVRQQRRWPWAAAAGIAAVVGVSMFVWLGADADAFQTAIGEQRRIALPDASTMELNTASRAAVDFNGVQRRVHLEHGEARFKVAQQPDRPFVVHAAGHLVQAVGTEFNVRIDGDCVDVLVVEGAVSFAAASGADRPRMVRAGEAIGSTDPERVFPVARDEVERRLAWHDGMVSFRGETLREVLAELERYNRARLTVADDAAAAIRVSGYFRATDIPTFLARLEENFPVDVRRGTHGTVIASRARDPRQP